MTKQIPFEVRCPLHGSIPFDQRERAIIDHPFFQRLRYISQLGFASLVYPGATHTRFGHSLGVMHLAGRLFDSISAASPDYRRAGYSPREHAYFRRIVRLAGLLHDLGHPPFSHSFEPLLPARQALPLPWDWYRAGEPGQQATHEDFSVAAIQALAEDQAVPLGAEEARDICALIDWRIAPGANLAGENGRPAVYPLLKQIISGEIDVDRMDYLRRDAHFAGVTYGLFDLPRLIQSLACAQRPEGMVMTLDHNGLYTYENFLMARFHMAMQVYFHKTLLPFEYFLKRAVSEKEIQISLDGSLQDFLATREDQVLERLYRARERRWSARIVNRKPVSRLLRLDEIESAAVRKKVLAVARELEAASTAIIHIREERRLSNLGWSGKEPGPPIYVERSQLNRSELKPLTEVSVLLERYNQVFIIESLYCEPEDYERCLEALQGVLD